MKIIIIAGGDRTGKSTLCKYFENNGYTYMHFGPPKDSPYYEYKNYVYNVLKDPKNKNKNFIIDRFMYCEFAYSKHYNRLSDMTIDKMYELENIILSLDSNATIIYCENNIDINWQLICDEGKNEFKTKNEIIELRNTYLNIFKKTKLNFIKYDYTIGHTPHEIFTQLN